MGQAGNANTQPVKNAHLSTNGNIKFIRWTSANAIRICSET